MSELLINGIQPAELNSIQRVDSDVVSLKLSEAQTLSIRYRLPIDGFNPNEVRVYLLEKQDLPEDSVLEIYLDNFTKTAGHVFPLRLFETEVSSYTQKPEANPSILRLQKAATAALCHFAKVDYSAFNLEGKDEPLSLVKLFGEDTVILTISNCPARTPPDFKLTKYLPWLYQYGFLYKNPKSPGREFDRVQFPLFESIAGKANLKLKKISADIPNPSFVESIFRELLPKDWSPITSFFLCYQVIELCIEEVRRNNCEDFISSLELTKNDPIQNRSVINEYQRDSGEKERIKKIFSTYLNAPSLSNVLIEGKGLLDRLGIEEKYRKENEVALYVLRNYFFHAFPLVQKSCTFEQLQSISWELFLLTLEILTCFKLPPLPEQ